MLLFSDRVGVAIAPSGVATRHLPIVLIRKLQEEGVGMEWGAGYAGYGGCRQGVELRW